MTRLKAEEAKAAKQDEDKQDFGKKEGESINSVLKLH